MLRRGLKSRSRRTDARLPLVAPGMNEIHPIQCDYKVKRGQFRTRFLSNYIVTYKDDYKVHYVPAGSEVGALFGEDKPLKYRSIGVKWGSNGGTLIHHI